MRRAGRIASCNGGNSLTLRTAAGCGAQRRPAANDGAPETRAADGPPESRPGARRGGGCAAQSPRRTSRLAVLLLLGASLALSCDTGTGLTLDYPGGGSGVRWFFTIEPGGPALHVGGQLLVGVDVSRDDGVQPVVGPIRWWVDDPEVVEVVPATPDRVFLAKPCGDRCALLIGRSPGRTDLYARSIIDDQPFRTSDVVTVVP